MKERWFKINNRVFRLSDVTRFEANRNQTGEHWTVSALVSAQGGDSKRQWLRLKLDLESKEAGIQFIKCILKGEHDL